MEAYLPRPIHQSRIMCTANEIIEKEGLPASVVYSALKELYRLDYIFLYPRNKKERGDRKKRYVCERGTGENMG
jgi:DNA-binding transcriptional regulator GbsR (MarR family)